MRKDLPRLYVITDPTSAQSRSGDVITAVQKSIQAGARFFQFRDKNADLTSLLNTGRVLTDIVNEVGGTILVNTSVDVARALNCHGVHRPGNGPTIATLRQQLGDAAIIGASAHSLAEAIQAEQAGADFVTISPVFISTSKPGYGPALNLEGLHLVASTLRVPVYALGGILPENTVGCLEVGAYGIAVMGGIMGAKAPDDATRHYLQVIEMLDENIH